MERRRRRRDGSAVAKGWRAAAKGSGVRGVRATGRSRAGGLARAIRSRVFFRRFFYRWLIFVDFFFVACLGRDRWLPNEERGGWWRTR